MNKLAINTMSASAASRMIESGTITVEDLYQACRHRVNERDSIIRAWTHVANAVETRVPTQNYKKSMRLTGIPIGVKDIFETDEMPVAYGTTYLRRSRSTVDAAPVALLRRAGAYPFGKTVTTELAYFTPGPTRNPHDQLCTPGGSSSGSAAAVADHMVPIALGTQTAGSVIRPASYCGVLGFKPTFNSVPTSGVKPFSPSLDTVGFFARSISDIELTYAALTVKQDRKTPSPCAPLRVRLGALPSDKSYMGDDVSELMNVIREKLATAGAEVEDLRLPSSYDGLVENHKTIMAYEAARTLAYEANHFEPQMSVPLRKLLETGLSVPEARYTEALRSAFSHATNIDHRFASFDAIIAPAASGEAPEGLETTGDPVYCRAWTLLGLPCISLPLGIGRKGRPIGLQLVGPKYADSSMLATARRIIKICC